jgi:hypothetical protein
MELIKQYGPPINLKDYTLDATDYELFRKKNLSLNTTERLIRHLVKSGGTVRITECYDGRSGWRGESFVLDGIDLSVNGYCFSEKSLINYLKSVSLD